MLLQCFTDWAEFERKCQSPFFPLNINLMASYLVPPLEPMGGAHSPAGEGVGGPNFKDWKEA